MSFFVQSTTAPTPKTHNVRMIGIFLTAILVGMAVLQLFNLDKFSTILEAFTLPGGDVFTKLYSSILVVLEVTAIPFLLAMRLSPAARFLSMVAGWFVVVCWLFIAVWVNITMKGIFDSGLLGGVVPALAGWWMVFFYLGLGVLVSWVSWGMWPLTPMYKSVNSKKA